MRLIHLTLIGLGLTPAFGQDHETKQLNVEVVMDRLRSASPELTAEGILGLLEQDLIAGKKRKLEAIREVEGLIGLLPRNYPVYFEPGSTETFANRISWFSTRRMSKLQLTARLFRVSRAARTGSTEEYFEQLSRLREQIPISSSCEVELEPNPEAFYISLSQRLTDLDAITKSESAYLVRTVSAAIRAFGEVEHLAFMLANPSLSIELQASGVEGLLMALPRISHQPNAFRLRAYQTHKSIGKLMAQLSGKSESHQQLRYRLGEEYRNLVYRQLSNGYCATTATGKSIQTATWLLDGHWKQYHDSTVGKEFPLPHEHWRPEKIPILAAAPPGHFPERLPAKVSEAVANLSRRYGRRQAEPLTADAEAAFSSGFSAVDQWASPVGKDRRLSHFFLKAAAYAAIVKAALSSVGQGSSARLPRTQKKIETPNTQFVGLALERWVTFIRGPEAQAIKREHRELWFGQLSIFFAGIENIDDHGRDIFWSILERYPDRDLQAIAIIDGFSPSCPRLR